jgi:hypothetical protein
MSTANMPSAYSKARFLPACVRREIPLRPSDLKPIGIGAAAGVTRTLKRAAGPAIAPTTGEPCATVSPHPAAGWRTMNFLLPPIVLFLFTFLFLWLSAPGECAAALERALDETRQVTSISCRSDRDAAQSDYRL